MDNMLSEADVPSSPARGIEGTHMSAYDALGRRVSKTIDDAVAMTTETTVYVSLTQPIPYSPWAGQVLAEYDSGTASTSPLRKYAYGAYIDEPLVLIDRTAAGATGAGSDEVVYYHRNQQYSTVALSNSSGSITEPYHYSPYGQTTITDAAGTTTRTTSDIGNTYTHTGRRLDDETGLHDFRARYVASGMGRFLNRDPLRYVDGASLYRAYFASSETDPSGAQAANCQQLHQECRNNVEKRVERCLFLVSAYCLQICRRPTCGTREGQMGCVTACISLIGQGCFADRDTGKSCCDDGLAECNKNGQWPGGWWWFMKCEFSK